MQFLSQKLDDTSECPGSLLKTHILGPIHLHVTGVGLDLFVIVICLGKSLPGAGGFIFNFFF